MIRNRLIRIGVQDHYGFPVEGSKLRFMKTALLVTVALATFAAAHEYDFLKGWPTTPEGLETIGDSHGEIDVDSEGNFYVSVVGGEKHGVQIYDASGKYLRNLPNARNNFHGFTIVQEDGKDVIYAPASVTRPPLSSSSPRRARFCLRSRCPRSRRRSARNSP